jgi:hypothetical protein
MAGLFATGEKELTRSELDQLRELRRFLERRAHRHADHACASQQADRIQAQAQLDALDKLTDGRLR